MREIVVDSFAGGGGASEGITQALGYGPDIAINHDAASIAMHAANHPGASHYTEDVWKLSPAGVSKGRAVGLLWASPDCKHFSRAKGGKPVEKRIRSLAWVVVKWAAEVRPRVIILENVREFEDWGPLIQKVVKGKRQVLDDGSPVLIPDPTRKGHSFKRWAGRLRGLGYDVQWRVLNAADYGAPTHRRRLFLVARCDGEKIVWPKPTHCAPDKVNAKWDFDGRDATPIATPREPWRTAAECIDWSIPCPSIFERKKPLADNTLRRIAMGIKRYVLDNPKPFIVQVNHGGPEFRGQGVDEPLPTVTGKHGYGIATPLLARLGQTNGNGKYNQSVDDPLTTITTKAEHLVITPHITKFRGNSVGSGIDEPLPTITSGAGAARPAGAAHAMGVVAATLVQTGYTERDGQSPRCLDLGKPLGTVVGDGKHAAVTAFLAKHFSGAIGSDLSNPTSTVTAKDHQSLVAAVISKYHGQKADETHCTPLDEPLRTVDTENRHSLVAANLVRFNFDDAGVPINAPLPTVTVSNHAALVYSFLVKYFGTAIGANLIEPAPTATAKDRFGLVTVNVNGEPYVIVDIGMRMLTPRELARAQGFPETYILTGSKSSQVARIGNSVPPAMAEVLVRANYTPAKAQRRSKVS